MTSYVGAYGCTYQALTATTNTQNQMTAVGPEQITAPRDCPACRSIEIAKQSSLAGSIFCQSAFVLSCRVIGNAMAPCLELGGHSHWVWQAKFNPCHDSLLLSASSDSMVNLWHTPLVAGESSRGQGGARGVQSVAGAQSKGFGKEALDGKACSFDDHEDSVYGKQCLTTCCW